jgi:Glucose / Sorbosone dehydrogenase
LPPNHFLFAFRSWSAARSGLTVAIICCFCATSRFAHAQYPTGPQIAKNGTAVSIVEYASLPLSSRTTSSYPPPINFSDQLGRVNFLRSEPGSAPLSASRFFVNDLNRNLYILDKASKTFTAYINFEEVFPKFDNNIGYSAGLVTFAFDPDYAANGKFYTVHTENPAKAGSAVPTNAHLPGFDPTGYTTTATVNPPAGTVAREAVLVEWTDTNVNNATFEGTARELLRIGFNNVIHPMGDLIFNPLAQPGDEDYRNLYIANGDGGSGEVPGDQHPTPQRLDALLGKVLRITPDLSLRTDISTVSTNGRYRIPTGGSAPNPFVSLMLTNLKKEIYAYGFRNPHRLSWDPFANSLVVDDIGLHSWEEVDIIHPGGNYGYAEREGTEQLFVTTDSSTNGKTNSQLGMPFPSNDSLVVNGLANPVTPLYPVANYSHRDGDAIAGGFVYRGSLLSPLYGKYIFGDITTGRIFYSDFGDMLAADDGNRTTLAGIHELQIVFNGAKRRVFDVISDKYHQKGGNATGEALPGGCGGLNTGGNDPEGVPYGCGRADIRLAVGGDGELYLLSKSDGMVRKFTAVLIPPTISSIQITNGVVTLSWPSIQNVTYRVQYKTSLMETGWTDLSGDVMATSTTASKMDSTTDTARFYHLKAL